MASTILGRLAKRRCYPVKIEGEEDVHVRALTFGEIRALDKIPEELTGAFMFGCGLVSDTGDQAIPRLDGEDHKTFAARVADVLEDREIPTDNIRDVSAAIGKLMRVPPVEEIAKNS